MKLSQFGQLMAVDSPIVELMEDLGEALNVNPDILFLGGGNPAHIPEAQACFNRHFSELSQDEGKLSNLMGVYQSPQGNQDVLDQLSEYYKSECGWDVSAKNIALVNGSQTAFFILFNLFSGHAQESAKVKDSSHILLPIAPEYLGYGSQGLSEEQFRICQPLIEEQGAHRFKYRVDFDAIQVNKNTGAICVSRPTNPSGNVLSDDEMSRLAQLAEDNGIPFIVDLAYGKPFPGLSFQSTPPVWNNNIVSVMSLSKLGLPGLRTSVIVAREEIIQLVVKTNTIMSLANGNLGPELLSRLLVSGDLKRLSQNVLPSFYRERRDFIVGLLDQKLKGLNYRIHQPEGAFFVWLWLPGLPISTQELYQRLKDKGVLVMAGEPFFFGLDATWRHAKECLRLSYCQDESVLKRAVDLISEELRAVEAG